MTTVATDKTVVTSNRGESWLDKIELGLTAVLALVWLGQLIRSAKVGDGTRANECDDT